MFRAKMGSKKDRNGMDLTDTKGTFHAKMGSIKNNNSMDLTEAEDIKKTWQEYTELDKKIFMTQTVMMVWSLEPDILECDVKWALGIITMNKASGGDGNPVELFQIPKRWCCESAALNMSANL